MIKNIKNSNPPAATSDTTHNILDGIASLYANPLPASRAGALYSAFSYPTKISPEAIAIFIASHTKPGDSVLDAFGGSGTTGLAIHLCADPTDEVQDLAKKMGAPVEWGPRNGVIYELSTLGAFVADTLCNPPDPQEFNRAADAFLNQCDQEFGHIYYAIDDAGTTGKIRYVIWSDILICANCGYEVSFWEAAVNLSPLSISSFFRCPGCKSVQQTDGCERVYEEVFDQLLNRNVSRRKRVVARVYGQTGKRKWSRPPIHDDGVLAKTVEALPIPGSVPIVEIPSDERATACSGGKEGSRGEFPPLRAVGSGAMRVISL